MAQQRPLGIGVILGDPTGISVKYWKSRGRAIDAAAAWSLGGNDTFQLHSDLLWHRFDLIDEDRTPVYYGLGVRIRLNNRQNGLGVRIPAGISHILGQAPIDLFFELAPVFTLVPNTGLDLEGGFGVRYYFKQSSRK